MQTHILPSSASCIDLTFTNQPNMVINSEVQDCYTKIDSSLEAESTSLIFCAAKTLPTFTDVS